MMFKKIGLYSLLMIASMGSLRANDSWAAYSDNDDGCSTVVNWHTSSPPSVSSDSSETFFTDTNLTVSLSYLYLKPTTDDTFFVIKSPTETVDPKGQRINSDLGFYSGFRASAQYEFCNCKKGLELSYTRLGCEGSKTVSGDFLWAIVGTADLVVSFENYKGTATAKTKLFYQRIDGLYNQQVFNNCGLDIALMFGLEAAELRLKQEYFYDDGTLLGVTEDFSRVSGVGPQIGISFGYEIYRNSNSSCPKVLSFNVVSSGSLLVGICATEQENEVSGVKTTEVTDDKTWRFVEALHIRAGLNYEMSFSCFLAILEIGYEFNNYPRGQTMTAFTDNLAHALCYTTYYNFDLQGLYISASARF